MEVKDQYGEEFNAKDIKIAVKNITKNKNIEQKDGKFDLSEAEKGDKILVTAVYVDADLSVTKEFEIRSESEIREIKLSELVPVKAGKEVESLISGEFDALYAEVEAFDQYGNKVKVEKGELETVYEPKGLEVELVDGEGANKDKQFIKVTELKDKEEDTLVKLKLMVVLAEGPVYSEEVSTTVLAKRQVASMEVVEEPKGSVSVGGTTTMKFKALDQYGEEMEEVGEETKLKVVVKDQNGKVVSEEKAEVKTKEAETEKTITVSEAGFNKDITITVGEKTEPEDYTIVVDLKAGEKSIDNYEFDLTVVDAVKSFEAEVENKEKYIAGEDIEITVKAYKAKEAKAEEAEELYDKYDGSHKVTIKIGDDSFIRELNFENGVAKAKVAPETAGEGLEVLIEGLKEVEVEPETIDVVAAEAKEYKLSQNGNTVEISLVDEFGNVKEDYGEEVDVKVTLVGAKSDKVTTEGDATLKFTDGVAKIELTEAEKDSKITVEYEGYKGSLVLEEVAGEDQGTGGEDAE